jgi:hypothetical protein
VLDGRHGGRGGVVDVDPRPEAGAGTDDGELALAQHLDHGIRGARSVEAAVAQRDALKRRRQHRVLQMANRRQRLRLLGRRVRIEQIVLGLHGPTLADVRPVGVALRDDALYARRDGRGDEVVGPLRAQLVRGGEHPVEVLEVHRDRQRGHLMHDRIGLGAGDRLSDGDGIEPVDDDGLGAEPTEQLELLGTPRGRRHAVAAGRELGHEPAADRSGCSCDEDAHCRFLSSRWRIGP